jgi:hypothetical protein
VGPRPHITRAVQTRSERLQPRGWTKESGSDQGFSVGPNPIATVGPNRVDILMPLIAGVRVCPQRGPQFLTGSGARPATRCMHIPKSRAKLSGALAPPEPQLQHAALRLTARGWETSPLLTPDGSGTLVVALNLHVHEVVIELSSTVRYRSLALQSSEHVSDQRYHLVAVQLDASHQVFVRHPSRAVFHVEPSQLQRSRRCRDLAGHCLR